MASQCARSRTGPADRPPSKGVIESRLRSRVHNGARFPPDVNDGLIVSGGSSWYGDSTREPALATESRDRLPIGGVTVPSEQKVPVEFRQPHSAEPPACIAGWPREASTGRETGLMGPEPMRTGADLHEERPCVGQCSCVGLDWSDHGSPGCHPQGRIVAGVKAREDRIRGCGVQHRMRSHSDVSKRPNVKHQRARATASRENRAISLRALRCMR